MRSAASFQSGWYQGAKGKKDARRGAQSGRPKGGAVKREPTNAALWRRRVTRAAVDSRANLVNVIACELAALEARDVPLA